MDIKRKSPWLFNRNITCIHVKFLFRFEQNSGFIDKGLVGTISYFYKKEDKAYVIAHWFIITPPEVTKKVLEEVKKLGI